jgi:hypothetical protein
MGFIKMILPWILDWAVGRLTALFQKWKKQKEVDQKADQESKEDIKRVEDVLKDEKATDEDFDESMRDSLR